VKEKCQSTKKSQVPIALNSQHQRSEKRLGIRNTSATSNSFNWLRGGLVKSGSYLCLCVCLSVCMKLSSRPPCTGSVRSLRFRLQVPSSNLRNSRSRLEVQSTNLI